MLSAAGSNSSLSSTSEKYPSWMIFNPCAVACLFFRPWPVTDLTVIRSSCTVCVVLHFSLKTLCWQEAAPVELCGPGSPYSHLWPWAQGWPFGAVVCSILHRRVCQWTIWNPFLNTALQTRIPGTDVEHSACLGPYSSENETSYSLCWCLLLLRYVWGLSLFVFFTVLCFVAKK